MPSSVQSLIVPTLFPLKDFWGFEMKGSAVHRTPAYHTRIKWLGTHNDLRMSRLLMSASELGLYSVSLAIGKRLVKEVKQSHPGHRATCLDYWLGNIRMTLEKHKAMVKAQKDSAVDSGTSDTENDTGSEDAASDSEEVVVLDPVDPETQELDGSLESIPGDTSPSSEENTHTLLPRFDIPLVEADQLLSQLERECKSA